MRDSRENVFRELVKRTSPDEHTWLVRVLLAEVNGIGEKGTFYAFHPEANAAWEVCCRLDHVCRTLHSRSAKLETGSSRIVLMQPFMPMLGQKHADLAKIHRSMENQDYQVENKCDGDRVMLHKDGDQYMFFTRRGKD